MHDDVTFVEFDRNSKFIFDDILPNFITRLKNHGNYSSCLMTFVRNEIVIFFIKKLCFTRKTTI